MIEEIIAWKDEHPLETGLIAGIALVGLVWAGSVMIGNNNTTEG